MGRFHDSDAKEASIESLLAHTTADEVREGQEDNARVIYVKERPSRWHAVAAWLSSFFLGVIATCLVYSIAMRSREVPAAISPSKYEFALTDPMPQVPLETVTFEADHLFSDRSNDESDYAWDMLLPPGRGYVYVPDAKERQLPPGEKTLYGEIYSVAMYHQLHCLARIRKMHWIFKDGIVTGETSLARAMADRTSTAHVQHCFDYLRQSLQCNGDMTLEWPKQEGPSSGAVVDGWGVPHTCKSPTAVKSYMDEFRFNMSMNIDAAG